MIKFEHDEVFNLPGAIRGMRNPMNSWEMSDSCLTVEEVEYNDGTVREESVYKVGEKDLDLMKRLVNAGPSHRKVLRQILVCVDITAPLYWWKEMDQYRVSTTTNSCSTMHKIHSKEFTEDDFSNEHLMVDTDRKYNYRHILDMTIEALNAARSMFLATKDKNYWWQMIQLLPSSYNQKRTVTLNYETLLNIYQTRKNHKLDEWNQFRKWIETLPYTKDLFEDVQK